MKNKLLTVKNLNKHYYTNNADFEAINDITFDVYEDEFISIVGPSGCGKSTILSILSSLQKETSGQIISNKNLSFGYMLQDDCLLPWRNILDNCLLGLEFKKMLNEENKKYVFDLIEKYGLSNFKYKFPHSLSGGMRQRVALIRTLALKPDILLLDEPLSALDSHTKLKIENDIYSIIKNENKTAIMVTHDIGEAICMSDKIIVLTNQPAKVKCEIPIAIPYNGDLINKRFDKNFSKYYEKILGELDE